MDEGAASVKYQASSGDAGYKRLQVWQAADDFAMAVYAATSRFPRDEMFGLTSQVRRAALAVPTNIVEGQASSSKREFRRFLYIANASLVESEYLLSVATRLDYLSSKNHQILVEKQMLTGKLLQGLIRKLNQHDT